MSLAEYGREISVTKSGMSRMVARGLPYTDGKDDHGRDCRLVNPDEADAWRAANLTPKVDGEGRVRGIVERRPPRPAEPKPSLTGVRAAALGKAPAPATRSPASGQPGDPSAAERIQAAKALEAELQTQMRQMAHDKAAGLLVDKRAAVLAHENFVGRLIQMLERAPADYASNLADKLGVEAHALYKVLVELIEGLRRDLARTAGQGPAG